MLVGCDKYISDLLDLHQHQTEGPKNTEKQANKST